MLNKQQQEELSRFLHQVHQLVQSWPGGCTISILPQRERAQDQDAEQSRPERTTTRRPSQEIQ